VIDELYMDADSCSHRLSSRLSRQSISVLLGAVELPDRATDEQQLSRASSLGRPIVTANLKDFARMNDEWSRFGRTHSGIIIWFQRTRSPETVADLIGDLCRRNTPESMKNRVFFV
jgi:hypothetical protein